MLAVSFNSADHKAPAGACHSRLGGDSEGTSPSSWVYKGFFMAVDSLCQDNTFYIKITGLRCEHCEARLISSV